MDLAAELDAAAGTHGKRLLVDKILEGLDAKNRATLVAALLDRSVDGSQIGRALRATGHTVSDAAVNRWRREPR